MAWFPDAVQRRLPETTTEPRISPTQVISHTIVGSAEGAYQFFLRATNVEAHFIVPKRGAPWQLVDTHRQADANYRANARAISIETEDNTRPDTDPWTSSQITWLLRIHRWAARTHRIPLRKCRRWDDPGIGYHSQFPGIWTQDPSKTCPGRIRVRQWHQVILPTLAGEVGSVSEEEQDMPLQPGDVGPRVADVRALLVRWRERNAPDWGPVPNTRTLDPALIGWIQSVQRRHRVRANDPNYGVPTQEFLARVAMEAAIGWRP